MKKFICLFLSIMFSVFIATSAFALEVDQSIDEEIELQYVYTNYVTSMLSISSKNATCKSNVNGIPGTVTKITVTQELQKKSGSTWTSIYGRDKTVFTSGTSFVQTYSSLDSGTYREKTIAKVYSGTSYETVTAYSSTVSC